MRSRTVDPSVPWLLLKTKAQVTHAVISNEYEFGPWFVRGPPKKRTPPKKRNTTRPQKSLLAPIQTRGASLKGLIKPWSLNPNTGPIDPCCFGLGVRPSHLTLIRIHGFQSLRPRSLSAAWEPRWTFWAPPSTSAPALAQRRLGRVWPVDSQSSRRDLKFWAPKKGGAQKSLGIVLDDLSRFEGHFIWTRMEHVGFG